MSNVVSSSPSVSRVHPPRTTGPGNNASLSAAAAKEKEKDKLRIKELEKLLAQSKKAAAAGPKDELVVIEADSMDTSEPDDEFEHTIEELEGSIKALDPSRPRSLERIEQLRKQIALQREAKRAKLPASHQYWRAEQDIVKREKRFEKMHVHMGTLVANLAAAQKAKDEYIIQMAEEEDRLVRARLHLAELGVKCAKSAANGSLTADPLPPLYAACRTEAVLLKAVLSKLAAEDAARAVGAEAEANDLAKKETAEALAAAAAAAATAATAEAPPPTTPAAATAPATAPAAASSSTALALSGGHSRPPPALHALCTWPDGVASNLSSPLDVSIAAGSASEQLTDEQRAMLASLPQNAVLAHYGRAPRRRSRSPRAVGDADI